MLCIDGDSIVSRLDDYFAGDLGCSYADSMLR